MWFFFFFSLRPYNSIREYISLSLSYMSSTSKKSFESNCLVHVGNTETMWAIWSVAFIWKNLPHLCVLVHSCSVLVDITKHYQKGKPKSAGLVIFMPLPHIDQVTSKGQCISNAAWPAFWRAFSTLMGIMVLIALSQCSTSSCFFHITAEKSMACHSLRSKNLCIYINAIHYVLFSIM